MTLRSPHRIAVVDPTSAGSFIAARAAERGLNPLLIYTREYQGASHVAGRAVAASEVDVVRQIRDANVVAIIPGAESGVEASEMLSRRIGLAGNDPGTTRLRRNKFDMAQAVGGAGVPVCRQRRCSTLEECMAFAGEVGLPLVVKPEESSGSDLVRICSIDDDVTKYCCEILSRPDKYGKQNGVVLVQEFMAGTEYTVDGTVAGGEVTFFSIGEYKKVNIGGAVVYDTISFKQQDEVSRGDEIVAYAQAVVDAVGIDVGPFHLELMMTTNGPMLVEIAARAHGGIGTHVVDGSFEPSFLDAVIDSYAVGGREAGTALRRGAITVRRRVHSSLYFVKSASSGRIRRLQTLDEMPEVTSATSIRWFRNAGDPVVQTVDLATCPGLVELRHADSIVIDRDIETLRRLDREGRLIEVE